MLIPLRAVFILHLFYFSCLSDSLHILFKPIQVLFKLLKIEFFHSFCFAFIFAFIRGFSVFPTVFAFIVMDDLVLRTITFSHLFHFGDLLVSCIHNEATLGEAKNSISINGKSLHHYSKLPLSEDM